jgi:Na+/alanine symporter
VGDTSHFQALATALSGTVGTGNIAGVALAIHLGGPAALFWMLMTAVIGMTTKFVEVTLSHKYREIAEDGTVSVRKHGEGDLGTFSIDAIIQKIQVEVNEITKFN